jgi:hypothetical protein
MYLPALLGGSSGFSSFSLLLLSVVKAVQSFRTFSGPFSFSWNIENKLDKILD